ncbi:MAG: hypothetical protein AAFQ54_10390 [Pseudomonadota bacterium]
MTLSEIWAQGARISELAGWAVILLLLPISTDFGALSVSLGLFIYPIAIRLAQQFGVTGLAVLALFSLPGAIGWEAYEEITYRASPGHLLNALALAYVLHRGPAAVLRIAEQPAWRIALLLCVLPIQVTVEIGFVALTEADRLAIELRFFSSVLAYGLFALLGVGAYPRRLLFPMLVGAALFGAVVDAATPWLIDVVGVGRALESALYVFNPRSGFSDLGAILSAVLIYEVARYLAGFDTRFPRSLPGRALPAPVVSIAIIALLGVSYA